MTIPTAAQPYEPVTTHPADEPAIEIIRRQLGAVLGIDPAPSWPLMVQAVIDARFHAANVTTPQPTSDRDPIDVIVDTLGRPSLLGLGIVNARLDEIAAALVDALGLRGWPHSYQPNNPHVEQLRALREGLERRDFTIIPGQDIVDLALDVIDSLGKTIAEAADRFGLLLQAELDKARTREAKAVEDATRLRAGIEALLTEAADRLQVGYLSLPWLDRPTILGRLRALLADGPTPAPNATPEHHDEQTLFKVLTALVRSGLSEYAAQVAISEMTNDGILFRERGGPASPTPNATQPLYVDHEGKPTGEPRVEVTGGVHIVPAGQSGEPAWAEVAPTWEEIAAGINRQLIDLIDIIRHHDGDQWHECGDVRQCLAAIRRAIDARTNPAGPPSSPTADAPAPGQGQDTTDTQEADRG